MQQNKKLIRNNLKNKTENLGVIMNIPIIIKEKDIYDRKKTIDIFRANSLQNNDQIINKLNTKGSEGGKGKSQKEDKIGKFFINELWSEKFHKQVLKESKIREVIERIEKLHRRNLDTLIDDIDQATNKNNQNQLSKSKTIHNNMSSVNITKKNITNNSSLMRKNAQNDSDQNNTHQRQASDANLYESFHKQYLKNFLQSQSYAPVEDLNNSAANNNSILPQIKSAKGYGLVDYSQFQDQESDYIPKNNKSKNAQSSKNLLINTLSPKTNNNYFSSTSTKSFNAAILSTELPEKLKQASSLHKDIKHFKQINTKQVDTMKFGINSIILSCQKFRQEFHQNLKQTQLNEINKINQKNKLKKTSNFTKNQDSYINIDNSHTGNNKTDNNDNQTNEYNSQKLIDITQEQLNEDVSPKNFNYQKNKNKTNQNNQENDEEKTQISFQFFPQFRALQTKI